MTYGACTSWSQATKTLGRVLLQLPDNETVVPWNEAVVILGEDHPDWNRDLIKQFINIGILVDGNSEPLPQREYHVDKEVISYWLWC